MKLVTITDHKTAIKIDIVLLRNILEMGRDTLMNSAAGEPESGIVVVDSVIAFLDKIRAED